MKQLGVIILAAGKSSRMGQQKLLLRWGEDTVLGHIISQWRCLGAGQIAIVHSGQREIIRELDRLAIASADRIENPRPERGMFSSIRCAAEWTGWNEELTHVAVVLGDQPHLREETLRRLVTFAQANSEKICQPEWQDRARHPVIMPKQVFLQMGSSSATNLKDFVRNREKQLIKLDDPGLAFDIDYPEDFDRARTLYFGAK